jgi:hypothetical protein
LKSLVFVSIILVVVGCSRHQVQIENEIQATPSLFSVIHAKWFDQNENHRIVSKDNNPAPHLFYDIGPDFSVNKSFVNAIILTPPNSPYEYDLDILSGQRFFSKVLCRKTLPFFATGVIPRVLDQLGYPQKILIFGSDARLEENLDLRFLRVKLLGAYVERYCLQSNCEENRAWLSRLVFVGVDTQDEKYKLINSIQNLQQLHDWNEVKKDLSERFGLSEIKVGPQPQKSLVVSDLKPLEESLKFYRKYSTTLNETRIEAIQKSCHALYDKLWNDVGDFRREDLPVKDISELKEKMEYISELQASKKPVGFAQRFALFTKKYSKEMSTCVKFVYSGNINHEREKFWFFSFITFFFRLHAEGYYFDCANNSWQVNSIDNRGKWIYQLEEGIGRCNEESLDFAMSFLSSSLLTYIRENSSSFFKFIDYDSYSEGTHNKIYSWVKLPNQKLICSSEEDGKKSSQINERTSTLFPGDAKWRKRKNTDFSTDSKIIY